MVMPQQVLEKSMNKKVSILLKDNRILEGKLIGFDEFMNLIIDETEETAGENKRRLNTVILRGNNVVSITPV
jgi:small nuclear ribonucleoprotein